MTLTSPAPSPGIPQVGGVEVPRPTGRGLPAWPVVVIIAGYPLLWATGFSFVIFQIMAVPMLWFLVNNRPVRVPPGFGFYFLFLVWAALSLFMLGVNPPGTLSDPVSHRAISALFRLTQYASLGVLALYMGGIGRRRLPTVRLEWLLGLLFVYTVAGGYLGLLLPTLEFKSFLEILLPQSIAGLDWVEYLIHPRTAQVQEIGFTAVRPVAPFGGTNSWGACLALLLPWFMLAWVIRPTGWRRLLGILILAASTVPIVLSVNRGLWLALALAAGFVLVRLAVAGNLLTASLTLMAAVVVLLVTILTPLSSVIEQRFENQHSNESREFTTTKALEVSAYSPVLGFGTTRTAEGSSQSIAIGKSSSCPRCGNNPIGQNGHFWMLLISFGIGGIVLFFGMFATGVVRWFRRTDATGIAGMTALLTGFLMNFYYEMMLPGVALWIIGFTVLWRSEDEAASDRSGDSPPASVPPAIQNAQRV